VLDFILGINAKPPSILQWFATEKELLPREEFHEFREEYLLYG